MRNWLKGDAEDLRETERLEAFSDGVIAIAITLLVLEIRVPEIEEATPDALWQALRSLWPNYLGYVISFATIGIMWANHHLIFRYIDRTDHYLMLTNLLFLFFVAAVPFPTALMAEYLGHPAERVGIIVYSGWFLLTALSYNLLWRYASTGNRLVAPTANAAAVRAITSRFNLGPPSYAVAFVLAFFSTAASLVVLLGLALAYVLPYRGRTDAD
ncbi:MAG TPA: TMEM175 family protein [Gemmatimonadales bacterium]|nr:TMEM175 family protein [Gemmatimonadales bacterium]